MQLFLRQFLCSRHRERDRFHRRRRRYRFDLVDGRRKNQRGVMVVGDLHRDLPSILQNLLFKSTRDVVVVA